MTSAVLNQSIIKTWNDEWRCAAYRSASQFFLRNPKGKSKHLYLLDQVLKGSEISIWAHQPNILASCGVVAPAFQLYSQYKETKSIPLFLVIDYDEGGDQRFRSPCLPSLPNTNGSRYFLNGAVRKSDRKKLANTLFIADETIRSWEVKYQQNMLFWRGQYHNKEPSKKRVSAFSMFYGRRITEASTLQILNDLSKVGITDILPVFASDIWSSVISSAVLFLYDFVRQGISEGCELLWWICPSCLERKQCFINYPGTVVANCLSCSTGISKSITNIQAPEFIPQHQLCNMIDVMFANANKYFMYHRSKTHFEKTCSTVESTGFRNLGSRCYTELERFNPPLHTFNNKHEADWNTGKYSFGYTLDLFFNQKDLIIENIKSGASTNCISGR